MNCEKYCQSAATILAKAKSLLEKLNPVVILAARLWVAKIFWDSAVLKLPSGFLWVGQGNWQSTIYLFEYEHPVPLLSAPIAAFLGTAVEFLGAISLALGLGARFFAVALLFMTGVIEFTYQSHSDHIVWALFLMLVLTQGAGRFSLDHILKIRCPGCDTQIIGYKRKSAKS